MVAERLRSRVEEHLFLQSTTLTHARVAVSIGLAFCPQDASTPEDLIRRSDEMLYMAKREGKNRVRLTEARPPAPGARG